MSRSNRRKRPAVQPQTADTATGATSNDTGTPRRRPLLRREEVRIENAPGYANPGPWSVRGTLTLYGLMMLINLPVSAIAMRIDNLATYPYALISVNPFLYLLYALLAATPAMRLAHESRRLRPLEAIAAGALMYIVYVLATSAALALSKHNADPHDAKQMAGAVIAGLLGGAAGAVAYPWVHRRLWMHRLPADRGGPRR